MESLQLIEESVPGHAELDTAVSRALLLRVAKRRAGSSFRLYQPDEVLAFSVFDRTRPGFPEAVAAARDQDFAPIIRLAGGKAALFHPETLAFGWSRPIDDMRLGIEERFVEMAQLLARALRRVGVDARIGEVPGEYCPGRHSVNARGCSKIAGIGQRVINGAAHVGGVIVVGSSDRVREPLVPVYRALGFDFEPTSVGSVEDEVGALPCSAVAEALRKELASSMAIERGHIDGETLALAEELAPQHRADADSRPAAPAPHPHSPKGVLESSA